VHSVLSVHNFYQRPGGEDQVYLAEAALLERKGHAVLRYEEDNSRISVHNASTTAINAFWNNRSVRSLSNLVRSQKPDIAHFHNTFPLITPSAYYGIQRLGIPVVQTLHNYRLLCPGATFHRSGAVCEECTGSRLFLPALIHGCYRGSRPATAAVAAMLTIHRGVGTWRRMVDIYIALSEFARCKFIEGGLPADRIVVKPNFVAPDPGAGEGSGDYSLFVGRVSAEKGIKVLAEAWRALPDIPLVVVGDGPMSDIQWPPGVTFLGQQPRQRVLELMRSARALIFPSVWYECAPMTILEAFSCALPVIASHLGSAAELVKDYRTGLVFRPGDAADLAAKVRWAFNHSERLQEMRCAARREFEEKYTAERNYKMLIEIYEIAIGKARRNHPTAS
jgi:glycosyltransferase involved in cell wall biosynthesis